MVAFLLSAVVSSALTPVSDSSAQTITVENAATGYYVSVTSPDIVELEVDATPVGQTVVSSANTVNVKTNAPLGYKLYLSTENDELTSTDSAISQTFKPVTSGSLINNTWGFSKTGADNSWLAVPEVTSGNESSGYLLASKGGSNIPDGDNIDVYYGINSDTTMPSGTYTTTVTYTAIGDGIPEEHTMQEFTVADCANMDTDSNFYLIDSRDNHIYKMVKARDGNCYMAENLKYKNTESTNWNTNDYSKQLLHIATNEGYAGEYYYNYTSAINVCPTGWTLPSGADVNTNGSWAHLINLYGVTTGEQLMDSSNPAYVLGFYSYYGHWDWASATEAFQGAYGNIWSSTAISDSNAYTFAYNNTTIWIQNRDDKGGGFPVRCVYQPTMQSLTTEECAKLDLEKTVLLVDTRDNKQYKAARLKDGNCWMQQNLALDGGRTLTPADSNVTANRTLDSNITNGTWTGASSDEISATNKTYIYNTGNSVKGVLYNWHAATATVGYANTSSVVTESVCPKEWKLPDAGSYTNMLSNYGVPSTSGSNTSFENIFKAPLFFVIAGYYYINSYKYSDTHAIYWTNTPNKISVDTYYSRAYAFVYNDLSGIYGTSNGDMGKIYLVSVRCLVS